MTRFALAAIAALALASQADAGIFGRGCNSGGCSTSGCSTGNSGCNVSNAPTGNDTPKFVPISNPVKRPTQVNNPPTSPPIAGPQGPQGLPGHDGAPGLPGAPGRDGKDAEVTQAQLDFIANHVLEQMRQDMNFRGPTGLAGKDGRDGKDGSSPDVPTLVAAIVPELPPIRVEFQGPNNSIASTQVVKIGGTIRVPPVVTATRDASGEIATAVHALGDKTTVTFNRFER